MTSLVIALSKQAKKNPLMFVRNVMGYAFAEKSFVKNQLLSDPILNQWGIHSKRVKVVHQLAQARRKTLEKYLKPEDVSFFYEHGYICKENYLTVADFQALHDEVMQHSFETREMLQGNTVTRRMALDTQLVANFPAISQFTQQAEWNALLNFVSSFKSQAMHYVQVIFAKVNEELPDPQTSFHSDTFYSSAKAWLFLTDVDDSTGPFMYVPGSHKADEKRLAWEQYKAVQISEGAADELSKRGSFRIQPEQLKLFGFAEPIKFNVKANTLLIADTFGFHARAEATNRATRIELWSYVRRNPMIPFTGGHYLALPIVKKRAVSLYWKALDVLEKKQIKRSPWRALGLLKVSDPPQIISLDHQNQHSG